MPQNPEHTFKQGPFEPLQDYKGHRLFGRYVPPAQDGRHAEYHVEVHRDGHVVFWAASFLPVADLPDDEVGEAEDHLHDDALAYAHALIDEDAAPSEEPYRRQAPSRP